LPEVAKAAGENRFSTCKLSSFLGAEVWAKEIAVLLGRIVCIMDSWFPPKSLPLFIWENTAVVIPAAVFKMTGIFKSEFV